MLPPMEFGLDILFATHNGAVTLPRMLAALERLRPPTRPWRIVAVDNASTDATRQILVEAASRLPLTIVDCPAPGKLPALKKGLLQVTGDLVVFTDDDVEPCPEWLTAYEAAAEAHPEVGVFGGPISPVALDDLSPWYQVSTRHHGELFARSQVEDGSIDLSDEVYGPNFMLRREHLDLLTSLPDWMGPTFETGRARRFPMGEDTAIMLAAQNRGLKARGVSAARVNHLVRGFQTDIAFMLERAQRHGRGWAVVYLSTRGPSLKRRLEIIGRSLPALLAAAKHGGLPDANRFEALWQANWRRGAALGAAFGPFVAPLNRTQS